MDQWLKVYSALAEGQSLVHRTHIGQFLPTYNSSSSGIQHLFLTSRDNCLHVHSLSYRHIIKNKLFMVVHTFNSCTCAAETGGSL